MEVEEDNATFFDVEPFGVDNGELAGLAPELIFTLGVEWEMIRQKLDSGEPFETVFHSDNYERVKDMCHRRTVKWKLQRHDDWPVLSVTL